MKKIVSKSKKRKIKIRERSGFFNSKTAKLFFVIIIAMAIPLTVMGVQRVQNLQQEAATDIPNSQICDGEANEYGAIAEPQPVTEGQEITFRLKDETDIVDVEKNSFGNGVISSTCRQNGTAVTCTAKGNFANGKTTSMSTWVYYANTGQKQLCKYTIQDDTSGTRPTSTPKPSPTPRTSAACNGKLETVCNVDNKPRLLISYDLRGGDEAACDVSIDDASQNDKRISINSKCTNRSQFTLDTLDGQPLKNNTNYRLVMKNGKTCEAYVAKGQVTTNCGGSLPSPTSPPPGGGTPRFGTPETVSATCDGNQDNPKITVSWKKVNAAASYTVRLSTAQGGSAVMQENTENTSFTFDGIEKDKTYWYTVIAIDNAGNKSGPTSNTRNIKCTNSNLQPTGVLSAIANTFEEMMSWLTM